MLVFFKKYIVLHIKKSKQNHYRGNFMKIYIFNIFILITSFSAYGAELSSVSEEPNCVAQTAVEEELREQPIAEKVYDPTICEENLACNPTLSDNDEDLRIQAEQILRNDEWDVDIELGYGCFSKVFTISRKLENNFVKMTLKVFRKRTYGEGRRIIILSNQRKGDLLALNLKGHSGIASVDSYYALNSDGKIERFTEFTEESYPVRALVMPYFDNTIEFYEFIVNYKRRFSLAQVLSFWGQIADALDFLHEKNIIHRDLKPENLLLEKENFSLKLIDFGFARILPKGERARTSCGSFNYIAPELIWGQGYGLPAEIWSFGVTAYVIMMSAYPFNGDSAKDVMERLNVFCQSGQQISNFVNCKREGFPDFSPIFNVWINRDENIRPTAKLLLQWVNHCKRKLLRDETIQ